MSSDDEVKGDEADREHAGGKADGGAEKETEAATKAAGYRDDPEELAASSDYAQRGTTNQYSGQSPGDESGNFAGGRESPGMHSGSQEQWRGAAATSSAGEGGGDAQQPPQDGEAYGGFRNEGPSPHDALQQKASDHDDRKKAP